MGLAPAGANAAVFRFLEEWTELADSATAAGHAARNVGHTVVGHAVLHEHRIPVVGEAGGLETPPLSMLTSTTMDPSRMP